MKRLALVMLVAGCDRTPDLHVQLHTPTGADLFAKVAQLSLTVTRDDAVLAVRTSTHPSSGVSLSGLDYGADTVLTLEGRDANESPLARGATCDTDFEKHTGDVPMYFAPLGYFGATASSPSVDRTGPAAALLDDGTVLVAGGADPSGTALSSVDAFTPGATTFAAGPSLNEARARAVVVTIPSVALVILGGVGSGSAALGSAELYFPAQAAFTEIETVDARVDHQAVVLSNGDVLVSGGRTDSSGTAALATTQELFVASDGSTSVTNGLSMITPRYAHAAVLVGQVFYVFGGMDGTGTPLDSIEQLDYSAQAPAFTRVATLANARAYATATSITYKDASAILVAGGLDATGAPLDAELYDRDGRFVTAIAMKTPRWGHTATLVNGGASVLITGGFDASKTAIKTVELFDVDSNSFLNVTNNLDEARAHHAAVTNCDGTVLLVGGGSGAELYTPSSE